MMLPLMRHVHSSRHTSMNPVGGPFFYFYSHVSSLFLRVWPIAAGPAGGWGGGEGSEGVTEWVVTNDGCKY